MLPPFLWLVNILLFGSFAVIHVSVDGRLGCFHLFATMSNTTRNLYAHVYVWEYAVISLGSVPRSGLAGSRGNSGFTCWRSAHSFPQRLPQFTSHQRCVSSSFPASSLALAVVHHSHPGSPVELCLIVALVCIPRMTNGIEHMFMCLLATLYFL